MLGGDEGKGPDFQSVSQHDYVEHSGLQRAQGVKPHGELALSREGSSAIKLLFRLFFGF